jgi:Xaa-Pro aminopeptidase
MLCWSAIFPTFVIAQGGLFGALGKWIAGRGKTARKWIVGIEAEHMTLAERKRMGEVLPSGLRVRNAEQLVEWARMVKDEDELTLIRAAVQLGATLFDRAVEVLRPGIKETKVAAEMEYAARRAGAEAMSFPTIIGSGARSALPHGRASEQAIPVGAFVVCDFGVILDGYCSDQTRTVWMGAVTEEARSAYQAVREAQEAAIAAVGPGVGVGEVDAAARAQGQAGTVFYSFDRARRGFGDPRDPKSRRRAERRTETRHGHHD